MAMAVALLRSATILRRAQGASANTLTPPTGREHPAYLAAIPGGLAIGWWWPGPGYAVGLLVLALIASGRG